MYIPLCISILLGLSVAVIESHDDGQALCTYSISPLHVKQHNHTSLNYVDSNNTQHCSKPTDACFILWQEDPKNKSIIIYTQGCWDGNDRNCKRNECIAVKKPSRSRNTSFCCCMGNFCNNNITDGYLSDSTEAPQDPARETVTHMSYSMQVVIAIVGTVALLVLLTVTYFFSQVYWRDTKRSNESLNLIEAPPPPPPTFDLDTLKIQKESIGQGGFGSVYCGSLNDRTVAVKVFKNIHKQYFFNEREIYTLHHIKHPSIPEYIGYQERTDEDDHLEYLLVLSYCPLGCLQNFLKERVLDWSQLCKMSFSIACGLSHLHTEIFKDDKLKHCITHRDLTSRNILMKSDGSCMICDFGFALQVFGSKYIQNGVEGQAEADSLTEVGTLRYKAPELLEGSVNLRDLESSLKQIDIYALGLILWEISSRCGDLYQGLEVPDYKLPFEAEVGAHATTDKIKSIVVIRKSRPLFPEIWKSTNPAIILLKETIEDCWDQDADARLTALCVKERVSELPNSWKRYKAELCGSLPSPTLNSNLYKSYKNSSNDIQIDCYDSEKLICPRERASSISECTTETLLSPSTEAINCKNLIISNSPPIKATIPLHPFQGRNPCMARNLVQQHSEDLPPANGNSLVDCTSKYSMGKKFKSFSDGDTVLSVPSSGIQNGTLTIPNRICNPIPYVQNQVHITTPKKTNMLGNHVSKDFLNKIAGLLVSLNRKSSSNNNLPEEQQLLKSSTISSPISPSDSDCKQGQINSGGSLWSCNENRISNDLAVNANKITEPNDLIPTPELLDSNSVAIEILNDKFLKTENDLILSKNKKFIGDNEVENCSVQLASSSEEAGKLDKFKRPSTLPVQPLENGLQIEDMPLEESDVDISKELENNQSPSQNGKVVRRGSGNRRKGVKRVQTPYEITARFSLIDDRIMSSQELPSASASHPTHNKFDNVKSYASVPDMNVLYSTSVVNGVRPEEKDGTKLKEITKLKPLNGLIVPVKHQNGHSNVLIV